MEVGAQDTECFAVPELGVFVPLAGVPEESKHPCEEAPCEPATMDHRTITFTQKTVAKRVPHNQACSANGGIVCSHCSPKGRW